MSDCTCEYDYDMPACEFFRQEMRKCRKERKCCECGKKIARGEMYQYTVGCWDGDFSAYKTCELCRDLMKRCDFFCVPFGYLWEEISNREPKDYDMEITAFLKRWRDAHPHLVDDDN